MGAPHDLIAGPALTQLRVAILLANALAHALAHARSPQTRICATLSELVGFTSASRPAA